MHVTRSRAWTRVPKTDVAWDWQRPATVEDRWIWQKSRSATDQILHPLRDVEAGRHDRHEGLELDETPQNTDGIVIQESTTTARNGYPATDAANTDSCLRCVREQYGGAGC